MERSVEWRRQNKDWGVYSRLEKTSDFTSNPNTNWLGVADPTVAMEKTMKPCGRCYWSPILFPHPFHPPLSSPVASVDSSVTCWQHPISTTCSILLLWGFSLTLWEPKSKAAWKYWRFHAPRDNLYPMRNGSQWKNTQVPYPLVTQFSGTW